MDAPDIELGKLAQMIGVEVRIAQILADRLLSRSQRYDLAPGQYMVLVLIASNPGINQSALARSMFLDRSTLVPMLNKLQQRGLIVRQSDVQDKRAHAVSMTPEGERKLAQVDALIQEIEASITRRMGKKNRDEFLKLTKLFQSALHAELAEYETRGE